MIEASLLETLVQLLEIRWRQDMTVHSCLSQATVLEQMKVQAVDIVTDG
jgi:hypothetical protein